MHKIISLTTIPPRLPYIQETLLSLLQQDVAVVQLNLPYFCEKTQQDYIVPKWLSALNDNNPKFHLIRCQDYGPATKILPTLEEAREDDIILICDDDNIYDPGWSDRFFDNWRPRTFVCANGAWTTCIKDDIIKDYQLAPNQERRIQKLFEGRHFFFCEAWAGMCCRAGDINAVSLRGLVQLSPSCRYSDDLTISKVLSEHGVTLSFIGEPYMGISSRDDYGMPLLSLREGGTGGNRNNYMTALPQILSVYNQFLAIIQEQKQADSPQTSPMLKTLTSSFVGATVCICFPLELEAAIAELDLLPAPIDSKKYPRCITVSIPDNDSRYHIISESSGHVYRPEPCDFVVCLFRVITTELFNAITDRVLLHASALFWQDQAVVVLDVTGTGKILLVRYLLANGFKYTTNELVCFDEQGSFTGHTCPLAIPNSDLMAVKESLGEKVGGIIPGEYQSLVQIHPQFRFTTEAPSPVSLFLFPVYSPGKKLSLHPLSPAKAALKLVANLDKNSKSSQLGFDKVATLARENLAVEIEFGTFEQLAELDSDIFPFILNNHFDKERLSRYLGQINRLTQKTVIGFTPPPEKHAIKPSILSPTPIGPKKKLTIGMATYDDYDGVYFSVQALRMYHPEVTDETEILVVDNNPTGPCSESLKSLECSVKGYRYFPVEEQTGTAYKERIFHEANSEYVMSIDCHVLIVPGAIRKLIDYLDNNDTSVNLFQGPLVYDDLASLSTHFIPEWSNGMYGRWGTDERAKDIDAEPFEIEMQGFGLFACAKDAWVGFNPLFKGFGGEEGYIHEKVRQHGGRTLCLPFLRWLHRFDRPLGVPYPINWRDRVYNYMLGFRELGLDCEPVQDHFRELLGEKEANRLIEDIENELSSSSNEN